jgi:hypothetical protein
MSSSAPPGAERILRCRSFRNQVNCSRLRGVVDDVGLTLRLTEAWSGRRCSLTSRIGRSDSILILTCGIRQKRHCCVHRWGARAGCADASSSLWAASAEVKFRWISVPAGGDHRGCAVVLALWALVP